MNRIDRALSQNRGVDNIFPAIKSSKEHFGAKKFECTQKNRYQCDVTRCLRLEKWAGLRCMAASWWLMAAAHERKAASDSNNNNSPAGGGGATGGGAHETMPSEKMAAPFNHTFIKHEMDGTCKEVSVKCHVFCFARLKFSRYRID